MRSLAGFFVENIRFTLALTFFVMIAGYLSFQLQTSESFPTVNIGKVVITTVYRGASTEDMEAKITKPIESQIRSVSGIKRLSSISQPSLSVVTTEVDIDRYNVEDVISDLQRAVDRTSDLPTDLENPPRFLEIKTDEMPIIEVAVLGGPSSFARNQVVYELSEEIRDNKKVSNVHFQGYNEPQFIIALDLDKMNELYLSPQEVIQAVQSTTLSIPAGYLDDGVQRRIIKIDGKLKNVDEIKKIVVRSAHSGAEILLSDVAQVSLDEKDPEALVRLDGQPASTIIIAKKGGEDIIDLSKEVKEKLLAYSKRFPDFEFKIYSDEGLRVGNRISVLYSNALVGLILVIVFLLIFLKGVTGLMAALSLPLAVLATFVYMISSGLTLNTITIMALIISIGMLVDNSVVIAENFERLVGEGKSPKQAAIESITSLWAPVTATALTTIAAFLPMMVTKGIMGQFIIGIPLIVTASLLFSLGESFFLLPARLIVSSKKNKNSVQEEDWFANFANKKFKPFLMSSIKHRYLSFSIFTGLLFAALFTLFVLNKFILFPANQTEIYLGRVELTNGSPIEVTDQKIKEVAAEIKKTLGEQAKFVHALSGSSAYDMSDPKGKRSESVGIIKIFMTDEAKNTLITAEVLESLRKIKVSGVERLSFEALINGPPVGDPLTLRLRSANEEELKGATDEMLAYFKNVEGVVDLRVNEQFSEPEVQIEIENDKAQRLGLSLLTVGQTFQSGFAGIPVNDVNINNRDVDYFIQFQDKNKKDLDSVEKIKVPNAFRRLIPLSAFSKVYKSEPQAFIERYDFKRAKTITSDVETDKITSMEANALASKKFEEISTKYPNVSMVFGGEAENTAESMESLTTAMVLALLGIFALLILVFNSFSKPFLVLTTIPLGLVGVSVAFFIQNLPLSFLAMIGVVGLSGIIVNSGIVLLSFIDEQRQKSDSRSLQEVLADSSVLRLRAVVITSLTTISGLIPTAYGIGGSDEFIRPMAMSISWGLLSGTLLTLVWIPCAYMILEDFKGLFRSKNTK